MKWILEGLGQPSSVIRKGGRTSVRLCCSHHPEAKTWTIMP